PPDLAAWIVMQICAGLHAAHEVRDRNDVPLQLVHRDIYPQNILLSHAGRAYLADFGIAKFRRETVATTQTGLVRGKFAYMSPEQANAKPLDRRSDIFSLGIVLYEAMTGSWIYDANSPAECVLAIVTRPVPDPREARPEIPAQLARIATRCLQKDPAHRF